MARLLSLAGMTVVLAAPLMGVAQEGAGSESVSGPICLLASVEARANARCFVTPAELSFEDGVATRFRWSPDPSDGKRRDYLLEAVDPGQEVTDHVLARLALAEEACNRTAACREEAKAILKPLRDGCTLPPEVHRVWSILRYGGSEIPLHASGHVFLCKSADRLLLVQVGPLSQTLDQGAIPEQIQMDSFEVAVFEGVE